VLFDTILINVTSFYRDPPAWEFLRDHVVPDILARKDPSDPVRVWSAGCASGEEAYTLAMVFAEHIGQADVQDRVKVYATDVDDDALSRARQASYAARELATLPDDLQKKYFEANGGRHLFKKDLRRAVIFGRHDLIRDAPISRIDLLCCRNTLMYLNQETQRQILSRFHFALNERGYLFLGKAETLLSHSDSFTPLDAKNRVFVKARRGLERGVPGRDHDAAPLAASAVAKGGPLRDEVFEASPVAQIVIDREGVL